MIFKFRNKNKNKIILTRDSSIFKSRENYFSEYNLENFDLSQLSAEDESKVIAKAKHDLEIKKEYEDCSNDEELCNFLVRTGMYKTLSEAKRIIGELNFKISTCWNA